MPNLLALLGGGASEVSRGQSRMQTAQQAAALFRGVGSAEATAFADLLTQDPRGAADVVSAFGGWNQLYQQFATNALNARKIGLEQQQVDQGSRRLDQGDRGLDIEQQGLEQRGKLGEEELQIRREDLEINRQLLGIKAATAFSKVGDLGSLEQSLEELPNSAARDAALAVVRSGKKPTDKLIAEAFRGEKGAPDPKFERQLSRDFAKDVQKPREEVDQADRGIRFLDGDPSAVMTLGGLYAFIKAIDSGSVVRPEELNLFQKTVSDIEKLGVRLDQVVDPTLLPSGVREDLRDALKALRRQSLGRVSRIEKQHRELASVLGVPNKRAESLFIGRLSPNEMESLGEAPQGGSEPGGTAAFDPATASDDEIRAQILGAAGGR